MPNMIAMPKPIQVNPVMRSEHPVMPKITPPNERTPKINSFIKIPPQNKKCAYRSKRTKRRLR